MKVEHGMRFEYAICALANIAMAIYLGLAIPVAYGERLAWLVGVDSAAGLLCLILATVSLKKLVTYRSAEVGPNRSAQNDRPAQNDRSVEIDGDRV